MTRTSIAGCLFLSILFSTPAAPEGSAQSSVVVLPASQLMGTWIAVTPSAREIIVPPGSRIVIANIAGGLSAGGCAQAVKDALVRRLIDNTKYEVLSRDDLGLILFEGDQGWGGRFNSTTAPKLGEILGAGYFIVGRISYCSESPIRLPDGGLGTVFKIFATLQVIDSKTGKVTFASASEGVAFPPPKQLLFGKNRPSSDEEARALASGRGALVGESDSSGSATNAKRKQPVKTLKRIAGKVFKKAAETTEVMDEEAEKEEKVPPFVDYLILRAADDLVDRFADKFLGRPTWERIEMWQNAQWRFGKSVFLVKLGDCPGAVSLLEGVAEFELSQMTPKDVAEYLHNYGVALLCTGQTEMAMKKLRSAYRINSHESALRMLGLAARIEEWSLMVEVDEQSEIKRVRERDDAYFEQEHSSQP